MKPFEQRLDEIEDKIRRSEFRQNKGLGNEVGYYVFGYPPEKELLVREKIDYLKKKNEQGNQDFHLAVFDLYDIIIDHLEEEGFLEQCYRFEQRKGMERIVKAVTNLFRFNEKDSLMIQYMEERTPDNSVVFLTGIGKCYPLLRSHKVLNNLHQVLDRVPVVLFYPGKYDGQELVLFDELKDDNYYRAFPLIDD